MLLFLVGLFVTPVLCQSQRKSLKLAFASCNNQDLPQPLWQDIAARRPDVFFWLGDIVYADTGILLKWRLPATRAGLVAAYEKQRQVPEYQRFVATGVPIRGIWGESGRCVNHGG